MSNANVARSLQDFKKPEIYSAVRSVLMAEAHLQLMRERVLPIQAACLAKADLVANLSDRQPITKMSRVYLSTDRNAVAGLYDTYKHALRSAGGFGLSDRQIEEGCCPELIAENLLVRAQNLLIELTGVIVGIESFQLGLEPRARYLELTLGMIVSMPDFKCELLAPPAATL